MPAKAPKSAFVTGGSGFIGKRLLRRLADGGSKVRALARSQSSAEAVEGLGAEAVRGDLDDVDSIAAGADGCEVAFHLAAHVADWGPYEEFEHGNVTGTRNAIEGCRRAGVAKFVHCGTEAAILAGEPLHNADESAPLRPDSPVPYSSTKAKADALVRERNSEGFETVVVRPRFVWGAGDTTLLPEMVDAVESGKWMWIGDGMHETSITHVDNVVEGLLAGAERGHGGEAYFVTDGEDVAFKEFITALLNTQGVEPPDRHVPVWVAGGIMRGMDLAWRALPLKGSPPLTRFAFWASSQECTIDDSKARSELGYEPVVSREEGMAEIAAG